MAGPLRMATDGGRAAASPTSPAVGGRVTALSAPVVGVAAAPQGWWMAGGDGSVLNRDGAPSLGSMAGARLNRPVVAIAATPDDAGYWLVASDGGIFTFGDATFHGSTGSLSLNQPVVGMAPTPDGGGYWLVASDGGIFTFGDAGFYGSTGSIRLNRPVVGMAATADGRGYWLVASDGGVFTYGDAAFHGSAGDVHLAAIVVSLAATADGAGYWLLGSDGGVLTYGDARFLGSAKGRLGGTAVAVVPDTGGYTAAAADSSAATFTAAGESDLPPAGALPPAPHPLATGQVVLTDTTRPGPARPGATPAPYLQLRTIIRRPADLPGPLPTVVFAHGWNSEPETYETLLDAWAAAGYLVVAPEFPGSAADLPGSPIRTDIVEQATDMSFVITHLLKGDLGPVDPSRIAVAGHSDGGSTVAVLALDPSYTDPRIDAYMVLSGATPDWLLPGPWDAAPAGTVLTVVGDADEYGNLGPSTSFWQSVRVPKALIVVAGGDHLDTYLAATNTAADVRAATVRYLGLALQAPSPPDSLLAATLSSSDSALHLSVG